MKLADKIFRGSVALAIKNEMEYEKSSLPHLAVMEEKNGGKSIRMKYHIRLTVRTLVFIACVVLYFVYPQFFDPVPGFAFFKSFSVCHLLWLLWVFEILTPLISAKGMISMGALKYAKRVYIPNGKIDPKRLFVFAKKSTKDSLKVFGVWCLFMLLLLAGFCFDVLNSKEFILVAAFLNVVDLVFVLYWCPLRVWFMKNRCCTTCRIFNWDHILIYSALFFVPGFFGYSLVALAIMEFLIWEICFFLHPERFWEGSNSSLRCANCTDKICGNQGAKQKKKETLKV